MAQIVYRGNLSSASFPFVSKQGAQTIIVPGPDQNFNRQIQAASTDVDKDVGIPQAYYMHNVMPTAEGYISVGYETVLNPSIPTNMNTVNNVFILRDGNGNKAYITWSVALGRMYLLAPGAANWTLITQYHVGGAVYATLPSGNITVANVGGVSYIYIANNICLSCDLTTYTLELVTLAGLSAPDIIGVTQSNGYLIAYTSSAVAWSSTIDQTDFVPSLETGAGGGQVEDIRGQITCAVPTANGFLIYSQANAVAAMYTGNSRYPFQFNECVGSGGVVNVDRVAYEAESGFNYAYTSKGMQTLQAKSALTSFPELTDFLAGQYIEDFDESTLTFLAHNTSTALLKKLVFIAARYLVISYGEYNYTHALVYDTVQKRFGKLRIPHIDCFEWEYLTEAVNDIPRKSIAFLGPTGTVKTVDFSIGHTGRVGVILFGKFQYVRSRHLQLQEAEFDWVISNDTINTYATVTYDGKTAQPPVLGTLLSDPTAEIRRYGYGSIEGKNVSILVVGSFNLNSYVLRLNPTGRV